MATKKQRRRREKLLRHEYEYVVDTEDGQEVVETPRAARPKATATETNRKLPQGAIVDARGRVVQPPSWKRVLKRGAIFGPILVVLMFVLGGNLSTGARVINALFMLVIFLPMSYVTDMLIYRSVAKRQRRPSNR